MTLPRPGRAVLAGVPLAFLATFFVWPLASIVWTGLAPGGAFDPGAFAEVLGDGGLVGVAWFTLWQAALSTVLTLVLAMPAAYVFARYDFPAKGLLRAAATVPFVLPTMVVGTAFMALVGPGGALGVRLDGTVWAILAAHVFFNFAVVLRTVGGLWAHLDPRIEEAALSLGANRWRTFTSVTLPLLRPAIAAAASIVFLFTFTSFGTVLVLGGGRLATLEVEIYRQTATLFDLPVAAVLALLQLVGVTAVLLAYSRYQERSAVEQSLRPAAETARRPRGWRQRAVVAGVLGGMAVLLGTPIAVLVQRSFATGDGWGLGYYRALTDAGRTAAQFVDAGEAAANSLAFAAAATVIALVVGLCAAAVVASGRGRTSRWFDALLMLPLGPRRSPSASGSSSPSTPRSTCGHRPGWCRWPTPWWRSPSWYGRWCR